MRLLISFCIVLLLSACTWVKMAPGGESIQVAPIGANMSDCERRGEVLVSVHNRIGPMERNELRVKDELEVLARNEAPSLGADTVQALAPPNNGEQRFVGFKCGTKRYQSQSQQPGKSERREPTPAETLPLTDD